MKTRQQTIGILVFVGVALLLLSALPTVLARETAAPLAQETCKTFVSRDAPKTIDGSSVVVSTLPIAMTGFISSIQLNVDIDHTFWNDVEGWLCYPGMNGCPTYPPWPLGSGEYEVSYSDMGTVEGAQFTLPPGGVIYTESFRNLIGKRAAAIWMLNLMDSYPAWDDGTLLGWSLDICTVPVAQTATVRPTSTPTYTRTNTPTPTGTRPSPTPTRTFTPTRRPWASAAENVIVWRETPIAYPVTPFPTPNWTCDNIAGTSLGSLAGGSVSRSVTHTDYLWIETSFGEPGVPNVYEEYRVCFPYDWPGGVVSFWAYDEGQWDDWTGGGAPNPNSSWRVCDSSNNCYTPEPRNSTIQGPTRCDDNPPPGPYGLWGKNTDEGYWSDITIPAVSPSGRNRRAGLVVGGPWSTGDEYAIQCTENVYYTSEILITLDTVFTATPTRTPSPTPTPSLTPTITPTPTPCITPTRSWWGWWSW